MLYTDLACYLPGSKITSQKNKNKKVNNQFLNMDFFANLIMQLLVTIIKISNFILFTRQISVITLQNIDNKVKKTI